MYKQDLEYGHPVDCKDNAGWIPLLYANFRAHESCIVTIMQQNPQQIFCLGDLINSGNFGQRQKNAEVVRSTIESISHIDAYYTLFNDFISRNISLLDTYNNGIFAHTWRGILSFENKVKWFRRGFTIPFCPKRIYVDCEKVLECAVETLSTDLFTIEGLDVTFKNEAGRKISSQLGPQ